MKVIHVSWNDAETIFHEMLWKKKFTLYPSLHGAKIQTEVRFKIHAERE